MFASDINSLNGCQKQPNPDHAVWGDVRRPAPGSIMRQGLRLVMLVLFVACGLALAGSKISGDLQKKLAAGGNIEVIVQFNHVPTSVDLQPFATHQIIRKFKHIKALHLLLTPAKFRHYNSIRRSLTSHLTATYWAPWMSPRRPWAPIPPGRKVGTARVSEWR